MSHDHAEMLWRSEAVERVLDVRETALGHAASALSVYEETFDPSVLSSSTRATRAHGFVLTQSTLAAGEEVRVVPYPAVE